jgi:hypothetical protein
VKKRAWCATAAAVLLACVTLSWGQAPDAGKSIAFCDFEDPVDLKHVLKSGSATVELVAEHATSGKQSLKVVATGAEDKKNGIDSSWYYFGEGFPRDWSNASSFEFDVYAEQALTLSVLFRSGFIEKPFDTFQKPVQVPQAKATTVSIPMGELKMKLNLRKMVALRMTVDAPAEKVTFYLDNFRLVFPKEPVNAPRNVRLSWTGAPATTMTVAWDTDFPGESVVEFGAGDKLGQVAKGAASKALPGYPEGWPEQVHAVTLKDLKPGATYKYRCGDGKAWSDTFSFTTAPADPNAPFTFCAGADIKDELKAGSDMLALTAAQKPAFLLFMGDQVPRGINRFQWDRWFDNSQSFAANVPIMTSTGDHEDDGQNFVNWKARNMLPAPAAERLSCSWDYGDAHFVAIHYAPDDATLKWLDADLATNKKKWTFVYAHWPFYTSTDYGSAAVAMQKKYGAILDKHKVTATFSGHAHVYERTKPVLIGKKDAPVESYKDGMCCITTGGLGAETYTFGKLGWWSAATYPTHHVTRVDVTPAKLTITAIARDGKVVDSFTIER